MRMARADVKYQRPQDRIEACYGAPMICFRAPRVSSAKSNLGWRRDQRTGDSSGCSNSELVHSHLRSSGT